MKALLFLLALTAGLPCLCFAQADPETWVNRVRSDSGYQQILLSEIQRVAQALNAGRSVSLNSCFLGEFALDQGSCDFQTASGDYNIRLMVSDCGLFYVRPKGLYLMWFDTRGLQRDRLVPFSGSAQRAMQSRTDLFFQSCHSGGGGHMPGYCTFHPNAPICRDSNYCRMHPGSVTCRGGGSSYCQRNPSAPGCR